MNNNEDQLELLELFKKLLEEPQPSLWIRHRAISKEDIQKIVDALEYYEWHNC